MIPILVAAVHKILDLAPQEHQPGIAVNNADLILGVDGGEHAQVSFLEVIGDGN
jgi:hypothetical protein